MNKLCILGGSSPFTVSLINELLTQKTIPHNLVLHGRNSRSLTLVMQYAQQVLSTDGWQLTASTNMDEALHNANIVLHQIRYGGMQGRADDEIFSAKMAVPADETLGPAALRRALFLIQPLRQVCEKINSFCPEA